MQFDPRSMVDASMALGMQYHAVQPDDYRSLCHEDLKPAIMNVFLSISLGRWLTIIYHSATRDTLIGPGGCPEIRPIDDASCANDQSR